MRRLTLLLTFIGTAAVAQEPEEESGPLSGGLENFFGELFSEVEPHLRELRDTLGQLNEYEAPEMLPNGDIIIRRKTPLDPAPEIEEEPEERAPIDI